MIDQVAAFRESRVGEVGDLLDACLQDRKDPAAEADQLVSRLRELYRFHRADFRSLVEHVIDLSNRAAISDWSQNKGPMAELPWSKISDRLKDLLNEPPLYERDWSQGPIEPQFKDAIGGWVDLADCARHAKETSVRAAHIDSVMLITGTMVVFRYGALQYFESMRTPGTERLVEIFDTILGRRDLGMAMFPAALTYFGSDGLQVLNQLATEVDDLRNDLRQRADRNAFEPGQSSDSEQNDVEPYVAPSPVREATGASLRDVPATPRK